MKEEMEIMNAVIESASINIERGFMVDAWLHLKHGRGNQGFGGYCLYHIDKKGGDYTGLFISKCLEMADVEKWENLKGKTIRIKACHSKIESIGHIVEDKWFTPSKEFKS